MQALRVGGRRERKPTRSPQGLGTLPEAVARGGLQLTEGLGRALATATNLQFH